jgi:hypothetical protein
MDYIALALEAVKLLSAFVNWWIRLDDAKRKEIRAAWAELQEAEKNGTQASMRSAVNRFNASL